MIVITADQIDSRTTPDVAGEVIEFVNGRFSDRLLLAAERTAGDEIQALVDSGRAALEIALALTRSRRWSVGIGIGTVREPLGRGIRESTGDAFVSARSAVERAKKRPTRFALVSLASPARAAEVEALVDLLLVLRARRTEQGWEMRDLVSRGLTQADAAVELGITPQSASKRVRTADLRVEDAAIAPLATLIDELDAETGGSSRVDS